MTRFRRENGISVLVACQNEEATLALCLLSFLDFADEMIIVDNGSTDRSKEIAQDLQGMHPKKIHFYDVPSLPDLHHNRQYAFSKSSYRWVVRADGDFVAYTDGDTDIRTFRKFLLSRRRTLLPKVYGAPLPNLMCDFWHTGIERLGGRPGPNDPGRYVTPPITHPTLRFYEVFPGFRFQRLGRWEATSFHRILWRLRVILDHPLWMHCNIKSDRDYLFRSERTNWRELGDFKRFPTLETYVLDVIKQKYGTTDLDEAAEENLQQNIFPFLQEYDPDNNYPYPKIVRDQMKDNPIYKVSKCGPLTKRVAYGLDPLPYKREGQ